MPVLAFIFTGRFASQSAPIAISIPMFTGL